jgi:hypothetical protein
MELYVLDDMYRRIAVVDLFESLIWTERFSAWGDFELQVFSTRANRRQFVAGVRLSINVSYRAMTIETIEDVTDEDGRRLLKIKGTSLEYVLTQRLAMAALTDLTTDPKWTLEGTPKEVADQLFHDICVTGILDPGDVLDVTEDNIFAVDTIPFPADDIIYSFDPKSLYDALKTLCETFSMGFRLIRDVVTATLYFDVYMGSDRTASQTELPAVIFSPDFDNLSNTRKLSTTAVWKNVAYVISAVGHELVYEDGVDPTVEGFNRRVLYVNANDIDDPDGPTASAQMIQRGKEELAKNRAFIGLDGEVAQSSQYVYGIHYNLGDLIEIRDDDGARTSMRVTEHIFISDKEGDRSYPSLTIGQFIVPDSYDGWPPADDYDGFTTETYDSLPG